MLSRHHSEPRVIAGDSVGDRSKVTVLREMVKLASCLFRVNGIESLFGNPLGGGEKSACPLSLRLNKLSGQGRGLRRRGPTVVRVTSQLVGDSKPCLSRTIDADCDCPRARICSAGRRAPVVAAIVHQLEGIANVAGQLRGNTPRQRPVPTPNAIFSAPPTVDTFSSANSGVGVSTCSSQTSRSHRRRRRLIKRLHQPAAAGQGTYFPSHFTWPTSLRPTLPVESNGATQLTRDYTRDACSLSPLTYPGRSSRFPTSSPTNATIGRTATAGVTSPRPYSAEYCAVQEPPSND